MVCKWRLNGCKWGVNDVCMAFEYGKKANKAMDERTNEQTDEQTRSLTRGLKSRKSNDWWNFVRFMVLFKLSFLLTFWKKPYLNVLCSNPGLEDFLSPPTP